jgi:hypothetical protein
LRSRAHRGRCPNRSRHSDNIHLGVRLSQHWHVLCVASSLPMTSCSLYGSSCCDCCFPTPLLPAEASLYCCYMQPSGYRATTVQQHKGGRGSFHSKRYCLFPLEARGHSLICPVIITFRSINLSAYRISMNRSADAKIIFFA